MAEDRDPGAQREAFLEVETKVKLGAGASADIEALRSYPLYPYLVYEELTRNLGIGDRERITDFLEQFADTPLAHRLRVRWLKWLYEHRRWDMFLDFYQPAGYAAMTCRYLEALVKTGQPALALDGARAVWLVGESQPDECDPVFALMDREGRLTADLVWARIELAMEAGRPSLARYLRRFLPPRQHRLVDLWLRVRTRPETILERGPFRGDGDVVKKIVIYGTKRWAWRSSPLRAARAWKDLQDRLQFTQAQKSEVARSLGLAMYRRHPEDALEWLARIPGSDADDRVHRARVLGSIKQGDWRQALHWLDQLGTGDDDDDDGVWRYWRARALAKTGAVEDSDRLFGDLAQTRSFYGFLAADRLSAAYQLNQRPLILDDAIAAKMRAHPALARIRELYALGRELDARREWHHLRTHLDKDELEALAEIAHGEGWHFHAILALGKSKSWDYLDIRFPLPYRDLVTSKARIQGVDPAWVYAVVRQESAFSPVARSPKGAMGLMQLLPSTARRVARNLKTRLRSKDLFEADANITFGTAYLRGLMDRFHNHPVLATASYNAGPHRVKSWLPDKAPMAADVWVEDIPFSETRKYVKRVFSYTVIYQNFLGAPATRLSSRLPPVPPRDDSR